MKPLATHLATTMKAIYLNAKLVSLEDKGEGVGVEAVMEGEGVPKSQIFERVLVAVGRRPNSENLGLENTSVEIDKFGFVQIDPTCRTADKRILAIGDVSGQPMLAHRAMRQP